MEIIGLDIHDVGWLRAFWDVEQAAHRHDRTRPLLRTFAAVASSYGDPTPHYRREPLAAVVDDRVVGIADLGFSIGDNEHLADLEIAVHPDHRRRGVGQALHAEATRRRRVAGRTSDAGEVYSPVDGADSPGLAFATKLGYSAAHGEHHLVVDLPVDPDHLAALASTGHDGYEIVTWTNRCCRTIAATAWAWPSSWPPWRSSSATTPIARPCTPGRHRTTTRCTAPTSGSATAPSRRCTRCNARTESSPG